MKFELKEYHKNITKEELIADLIKVSQKLNKKYISRTEYEKNGSYSATPYLKMFGSWLNALQESGLNISREQYDYIRISDKELLDDCKHLASLLKKKHNFNKRIF